MPIRTNSPGRASTKTADHPRPRVFCSKCITFEPCRWNAGIIASRVVEVFKDHLDFVVHCPEQEIGLGVPRDRIRVVADGEGTLPAHRLVQSSSGTDITPRMTRYVETLLRDLPPVDGFILKGRSPSCGFERVPLYGRWDQRGHNKTTAGFLGQAVLAFPGSFVLVNEGRLENPRLREDFLLRIHVHARFRRVREDFRARALVDFHERHKLILKAYDPARQEALGRLVAHQNEYEPEKLLAQYEAVFREALARPPAYPRHVNVLQHAVGYFKRDLTPEEKQFFRTTLEAYERNVLPLSAVTQVLRGWIVRFNERYLARQYYFDPFPAVLMERDAYMKSPIPIRHGEPPR